MKPATRIVKQGQTTVFSQISQVFARKRGLSLLLLTNHWFKAFYFFECAVLIERLPLRNYYLSHESVFLTFKPSGGEAVRLGRLVMRCAPCDRFGMHWFWLIPFQMDLTIEPNYSAVAAVRIAPGVI